LLPIEILNIIRNIHVDGRKTVLIVSKANETARKKLEEK